MTRLFKFENTWLDEEKDIEDVVLMVTGWNGNGGGEFLYKISSCRKDLERWRLSIQF